MRQSTLKNILVNLMTHQLPIRDPQIRKIISDFKRLDADGDGVISPAELQAGSTFLFAK